MPWELSSLCFHLATIMMMMIIAECLDSFNILENGTSHLKEFHYEIHSYIACFKNHIDNSHVLQVVQIQPVSKGNYEEQG